MKTLVGIIQEIQKLKGNDLKFNSLAYGPVRFEKIVGDRIEVTDFYGDTHLFDQLGRIHMKGSCLLFPEDGSKWRDYLTRIRREFYDGKLKSGDVCLVKKTDEQNWSLAIYVGKQEGTNFSYLAKQGVDSEEFKYCISYSDNSSYLGRAMFPDWFIDEDE